MKKNAKFDHQGFGPKDDFGIDLIFVTFERIRLSCFKTLKLDHFHFLQESQDLLFLIKLFLSWLNEMENTKKRNEKKTFLSHKKIKSNSSQKSIASNRAPMHTNQLYGRKQGTNDLRYLVAS